MKIFYSLLVLLMLSSPTLHAELPPFVYEQNQEQAEEKLGIQVSSVERTDTSTHSDIHVTATVETAHRSQSKLAKGQVIQFTYRILKRGGGFAGPSNPLVAEAGQQYLVFLNTTDEQYTIAARGKSLLQR